MNTVAAGYIHQLIMCLYLQFLCYALFFIDIVIIEMKITIK